MHDLLEQASCGQPITKVLEALLLDVELLLQHEKMPRELGMRWLAAMELVNVARSAPARADAIAKTGVDHVDFDVALLERSTRSRTGFAGVYSTSGGTFRALVPDPERGGTKYLASRPTALQAAIDRYEWHQKFKLPYGNLAYFIDEYKQANLGATDRRALEEALDFADRGLRRSFSRAQVLEAIANLDAREDKGKTLVEVFTEPQDRLGAPEADEICHVCKELFFPHQGKSFVLDTLHAAHVSCLNERGEPLYPQEYDS